MKIDFMEQVAFMCNDHECICDEICCQACDKMMDCENKCQTVIYKNKIYGDYKCLAEELDSLAEKEDLAMYAVAAQVIRSLETELAEGDYWMQRAKTFSENGGCLECFGTDEGGHKPGCHIGQFEAENTDKELQIKTFRSWVEKLQAENAALRARIAELESKLAVTEKAFLLSVEEGKPEDCGYCPIHETCTAYEEYECLQQLNDYFTNQAKTELAKAGDADG